jgi:predicted GIY-YIG superfamily endonuclease
MYMLLRGPEVIYIGVATNARMELEEHLAGKRGSCTAEATHFFCQLSSDPAGARDVALKEFQTEFGRLPKCNE